MNEMEGDLTEDEMLIRAMEESLRHYEEVEKPLRHLMDVDEPVKESSRQVTAEPSERKTEALSSPFVFKAVLPASKKENSKVENNLLATDKTVPEAQPFKVPATFSVKFSSSNLSHSKPSTSTAQSSTGGLWQEYGSRAGPSTSKDTRTNVPSSKLQTAPGTSSSAAQSSSSGLWQQYGSRSGTSASKETVTNESSTKLQTKSDSPNQSTSGQESGPKTENADPLQLLSEEKALTEDGFCMFTGRHWVYPTNYPERKYQLDMVQTALFHNTLVCLPTGLGKTFIAAVVMYNFYRWYPKGKIIFMAPTKPLVAQQIKACYEITGIPKSVTEEMTGAANPERRSLTWKKKRVFFATPQVVANDLVAQVCPGEEVRCLVVDEAHRAQGNYSYCQVVNNLRAYTQNFRILALSATPGSDVNAVKQVLENLHISKLKIATEDCPDVAQYTHHRAVEIIKVSLTPELNEARERFLTLMEKYLQPLAKNSIISAYNQANITQFQMKTSMDKFMKSPPNWLSPSEVSRMQSFCLISITLCHAQELLQNYGLRSFLSYIQGVLQDGKSNKFVVGYLSKDESLLELIEYLNERLGNKPNKKDESNTGSKIIYGHPKLQKLQEIAVNHFLEYEERNEKTRAIIFCQYRDSVEEIKNLLTPLEPIVKPLSFVGQAKSKGSGGLTQKQQLQVMRDFRSGDFNTLISTCVGEEGLDIGEVDLIICVDASKSPVRLVQRMGRCGRKRSGRIVMLLSEGREYKKYIDSTRQQSTISKAIMNNQKLVPILNQIMSPRMVPRGLTPVIYRTVLVIPQDITQPDIRKVFRKVTLASEAGSAFPSAAELTKWDGVVPEFKHLELIFPNNLLSFTSLDEIFPPSQAPLQQLSDENDRGFQFEHWLEWQRNLQGPTQSFHSSDTEALSALLQLADRLNLNNPTLLTQTTDLVSKVDHDNLLVDAKKKGKAKGKKSSKEVPPGPRKGDIAWCLQQQGQNHRLPRVPVFFTQTDMDEFKITQNEAPKIVKAFLAPLPAELMQAVEYLKLENSPVDEHDPFKKLFLSLHVVSDSVRKIKNKHFQPDLTKEPPDICELDQIFSEMKLKKGSAVTTEICDTQQVTRLVAIPPANKYLVKKRKVTVSETSSKSLAKPASRFESPVAVTISKKEPEENIKDELQEADAQSRDASPINKPVASASNSTDTSQGMNNFLMNFDIFVEDTEDVKVKPDNETTQAQRNVPEPGPSRLVPTVIEVDSSPEDMKVANHQNLSALSAGMNDFLMNFDLGFDDDDEVTSKQQKESERKPPESKLQSKQNCEHIAKSVASVSTVSKTEPQPSHRNSEVNKKSPIQEPSVPKNKSLENINFDMFGEDDDIFADVDVDVWMGEIEKKSAEMKLAGNEKPSSSLRSPPAASSPPTSSKESSVFSSPCTPVTKISTADTSRLPSSIAKTLANKKSPDIFASDFNDTPSPINRQENFNPKNAEDTPKNKVLFSKSNSPIEADATKTNAKSPILFDPSSSNSSTPSTSLLKNKESDGSVKPINNTNVVPKVASKLSIKNRAKTNIVDEICAQNETPNKSTTSEEEIFFAARKKVNDGRKAIILSSDDEDTDSFHTPTRVSEDSANMSSQTPKQVSHNDVVILLSSDERDSSPDVKKKQLSSVSAHTSDDEFAPSALVTRKRKSLEEYLVKPKKAKKLWKANEFLDNEAEVSGERGSEDEQESSQMDKYDESFINNYTQADPSIDIQAQYLQSVRSQVHGQGKFKIPEMKPGRGILMSPKTKYDESSYMNDSFCVESEEERDTESEGELDQLEAELEKKSKRKKKRKERSSDEEEEGEQEVAAKPRGKRLKRIVIHSQSSSDDELAANLREISSLEHVPPLASSTPQQKITGFEGDYLEDDADLDAIMARFSTQEAAEEQRSKKSSSRSLFKAPQQEIQNQDERPFINQTKPPESSRYLINAASTSHSKLSVYKNKPTLSVPSDFESEPPAPKPTVFVPKRTLSLAKPEKVEVPKQMQQTSVSSNNLTWTLTRDGQSPTEDGEKQAVRTVLPQIKTSMSLGKQNEASSSRQPVTKTSKSGSSSQAVIIASTRQVVSAPNLLMVLRKQNVNVVIKTLPSGVDFVLSQRLAVARVPVQDVSSCSEQSELATDVRSLRHHFKFVVLILENNASRPVPEPRGNNWEVIRHMPPGARQLKAVLGRLRKVDGLKVVFSKDQVETASILQKLAGKENQCNFGIIASCKESSDSEFDNRVKFFSTLPGVNIALALKLVHQFPVIADFIKSCRSVAEIEKLLSIDGRQAASLHQVLSRNLQ